MSEGKSMYFCCATFKDAYEVNTSLLPAIGMYDGKYCLLYELYPINFCPWCGKKLEPELDENYEASKYVVGVKA